MIHQPEGLLPVAYADESFLEDRDRGYYILAAAVFEEQCHEPARELLRGLRQPSSAYKLHWNEMDKRRQLQAAARVAELDGVHVVTVGSPVPPRRQERARAACLTRLVTELHWWGVEELFLEARSGKLNARDVATVQGARYSLPKETRFRIRHLPGVAEPLFWAADVVAGAVRAHQEGRPEFRALLTERLNEIGVSTGC